MDRTQPILDALTTRAKQRVLSATLLHPERSWYLHELAKHLQISPSTLQHELRLFSAAGLLKRTQHGNRVYYQADRNSPVFRPLAEVLIKTSGLVDVVKHALKPLAVALDVAFIYGSVAAGEEGASSDVDLMIIGRASLSDVAAALPEAEKEIGREINPTVYTTKEFLKNVKEGHHFLTSVLQKELLFVNGTSDDLAKLTGRTVSEAPQDKREGASRSLRRRRTGSKGRKSS
jgi:predicted nucleotidyltransferase/DNA-binding HxlR family transcriptional regulator